MKKLLLLFTACILFLCFGCVGIESTLNINANGSGTLLLQYRVSQLLVSMGQTEEEGAQEPPLPLTEDDFRQAVRKSPGLTLRSVTREENESDVIIKAEIAFNSVNNLAASPLFADMPITFRRNGNNVTFSQVLTKGGEEMSEEQLQAMESFFQGYELGFVITAPGKIISYNRGELSQDGRTLTYRISMTDLLQMKEKTELTVTW
jgi:hypothetical protein